MFGTPSRRFMALVASFAAMSTALATVPAQATSLSKETGVSATEIVLGTTVPMSGPASPGYRKVAPAMQAYFDYVNDKGGIYGRKIRLVVKDDQYSPGLTKRYTNELILKDRVFATVGSLGTGTHKSVIGDLKRRGIPDLFPSTGFTGFNSPSTYPTTFTFLPAYQVEAKVMGEYIKKNFAGKKVGIITQSDDFGRDAIAGFKSVGVTFEGPLAQTYAPLSQTTAGLGSQLTALKAAGAEVVVFFGVSSAAAVALVTAGRLSYSPKWIMTSVGSDATTLAALKVPPVLLDGVISASFAPSITDESNAWIKFFKEINTQYNKGSETAFDNNVLIGLTQAFLVVQALSAAGKNLTRKGLISAIETQGSKFANPTLVPLGYSKTNHAGPLGYWIGTYNKSGQLTPLGGSYTLYTTTAGSAPVVTTTKVAQSPLPANGLPAKR